MVVSKICLFSPRPLGRWSNLTLHLYIYIYIVYLIIYVYIFIYTHHIFQMGWFNHQLDIHFFSACFFSYQHRRFPENSFAGTLIHKIGPEPIVRNWKGGGPIDGNPITSMYGIFTYIYHIVPLKKQPNVGKYTIHGWYGNFMAKIHGGFPGVIFTPIRRALPFTRRNWWQVGAHLVT